MRVPRPRVRCWRISTAASISSCPVRKTSTSPGSGCVMCVWSVVTTAASR